MLVCQVYDFAAGPVEQWLGEVEKRMKASVRNQTQKSLLDYAVRPRPEWVRNWPAMAVLAVSAICWSQVCYLPSLLLSNCCCQHSSISGYNCMCAVNGICRLLRIAVFYNVS